MKKILSILLALSIACGSVMLTSCGVDEKEEDDDKSVSDKERDEDEDDDKDKSDKDDDKSDEDEEDEKSDDEDKESSEDEEEESSEDEMTIETADSYAKTVYTATSTYITEYFENSDGKEAPEGGNGIVGESGYVEGEGCNSIAQAIDKYMITNYGEDVIGTYWAVYADETSVYAGFWSEDGESLIGGYPFSFGSEDDEFSDGVYFPEGGGDPSEDEGSASADGTYAAGDVVEFSGVSFIVPEGFTCEVTDGYAEITSEDEYALESINVQATSADDISTYSQETFDGMYEKIYSDSFTSGTYEVSTLDGADTIYYTASIAMEGISMELIQYCIFLEDASIIATMGYVDGEVAATMDAFVDSFEIL